MLELRDSCRPDDWRSLLPEVLAAEPFAAEQLELQLARFATSDVFRRLTAATACHRDLEFLLSWPTVWENEAEGVDASSRGPWIQGVIDCLWEDGTGWHLLAYATDQRPASRKDKWRGRKPRLVLWAWAVQQQLGCGRRA